MSNINIRSLNAAVRSIRNTLYRSHGNRRVTYTQR